MPCCTARPPRGLALCPSTLSVWSRSGRFCRTTGAARRGPSVVPKKRRRTPGDPEATPPLVAASPLSTMPFSSSAWSISTAAADRPPGAPLAVALQRHARSCQTRPRGRVLLCSSRVRDLGWRRPPCSPGPTEPPPLDTRRSGGIRIRARTRTLPPPSKPSSDRGRPCTWWSTAGWRALPFRDQGRRRGDRWRFW